MDKDYLKLILDREHLVQHERCVTSEIVSGRRWSCNNCPLLIGEDKSELLEDNSIDECIVYRVYVE